MSEYFSLHKKNRKEFHNIKVANGKFVIAVVYLMFPVLASHQPIIQAFTTASMNTRSLSAVLIILISFVSFAVLWKTKTSIIACVTSSISMLFQLILACILSDTYTPLLAIWFLIIDLLAAFALPFAVVSITSLVHSCILAWMALIHNELQTFALYTLPVLLIFLIVEYYMCKASFADYTHDLALFSALNRDTLTKCYNRYRLYNMISKNGAMYTKGSTGIIMLDIDFFKKVNDTFGHQDGDIALCSVAATLQNTLKVNYDVFRYGGEEFLVLIYDTDIRTTTLCAEALRRACNTIYIHDRQISISLGVAVYHKGSILEKIDIADKALYKAKTSGRNRVCTEEEL